jgi:hypothetical protein
VPSYTGAMSEHFLRLTVVHEDQHLLELSVWVSHGEWSAKSTVYVSPAFLPENGKDILNWVESPKQPMRIEAGANTGIGWMVLHFYTIDCWPRSMCRGTCHENTD